MEVDPLHSQLHSSVVSTAEEKIKWIFFLIVLTELL